MERENHAPFSINAHPRLNGSLMDHSAVWEDSPEDIALGMQRVIALWKMLVSWMANDAALQDRFDNDAKAMSGVVCRWLQLASTFRSDIIHKFASTSDLGLSFLRAGLLVCDVTGNSWCDFYPGLSRLNQDFNPRSSGPGSCFAMSQSCAARTRYAAALGESTTWIP